MSEKKKIPTVLRGKCLGEVEADTCGARHWTSDGLRWAQADHRCVECGTHYTQQGYEQLHASDLDGDERRAVIDSMLRALGIEGVERRKREVIEINAERGLCKVSGSRVWTSYADALAIVEASEVAK